MPAIQVSQLTKAYKLYPTPWARLREWLPFNRKSRHQLKWVLNDISFSVEKGEALGIIGLNGAGKSTLLKIITGTTQATTGSVQLIGHVVALLELGMGFHPEFTGRQNVYMSGQLLGLTQLEIDTLMPSIEAFAEIGDYIDQPVRIYSSGMQVRLAFSIATAKRPDILIIDEALSVGDTYFQHKSFDRIRQFRQHGTTLLLVSHDKSAIQAICDTAILLAEGNIAMQGVPEHVMDYYNAMIAERENDTVTLNAAAEGKTQTISGTGEATIEQVKLLNDKNQPIEAADVGQKVILSIDVVINQDIDELVLGYVIKDRLGLPIFGTNTHHLKQQLYTLQQGEQINYQFDFHLNLGEGTYSVAIALHTADTHIEKNYQWRDLALVFNTINISQSQFVGTAWLPPKMRCTREQ